MCLSGQRDDRGQRALHERADRDELQALIAREQQLRLVGDRHVDLAGGEQLQRFGRFGGRLGCTSRPTARKSPWAIAEYSAAWSALGKKSSITVNGLARGRRVTSCLVPQAASASAHASRTAPQRERRLREGAPWRWRQRRACGDLVKCLSSGSDAPRRQPALGEREGIEAGDREHEQHDGAGVRAGGLEA